MPESDEDLVISSDWSNPVNNRAADAAYTESSDFYRAYCILIFPDVLVEAIFIKTSIYFINREPPYKACYLLPADRMGIPCR